MDDKTPLLAKSTVAAPLRWTLASLWVERLLAALWPLFSLTLLALSAVAFGLPRHLSLDLVWIALLALISGILGTLWYARRHFTAPKTQDAIARLDAGMAGAPLAALADAQAIGADDPASVAVWAAHRARMAQRLAGLRAAPPQPRLAAADPFALRHIALTAGALALLFGAPLSQSSLGPLGTAAPQQTGPMWEAWASPPAYTGRPTLYLADQLVGPLMLPTGTRIELRLYGAPGDVILDETISARTDAAALAETARSFTVAQSGTLNFKGRGGRDFDIIALPDTAPTIAAAGAITRAREGRFSLPFTAADDYGVTKGQASIALDLPAAPRQHGLATPPDAQPATILDLPLPRRGGRNNVEGDLVDDLSKSVLANLPVSLTLQASDGAGQTGTAAPITAVLPAKRFFDPLAAAVIEMRRDILWARANAPRAAQILKAVTHAPEGFVRNQRAYLRLRAVIAALDAKGGALDAATRDTLAEEMWQIALLVEEGDLTSARERLRRAQDRLDEAIRKGASPEETAELMQEMQDALKNYMRQLAEEARKRGDETSQNQDGPSMSQDQLQQMLEKLQQLMDEGKTAEAAELMQRLREFMENMQIAEGGDGQGSDGQGGEGGPSGQAMRELGDTLRGQQQLSDDAFRDMQQGGDGQGQSDQGEGDLAQRQQDLRDRLDQLQQGGTLPGEGSTAGEAGRQALDDAARAMEQAEDALRSGDLPRALDGQAEALEALRNGVQNLGEALAQEQRQGGEQGQEFGREMGEDDPRGRDPLGRQAGRALRNGSDENLLQGEDVYRRAEELLEEIRRRSGEGARPEDERNYLKRLLELF
ncbi:MAG: DUF4175 family protein [Cypionkella sp.]|nr:DUF4175 family protein [Cypionkella sp.]